MPKLTQQQLETYLWGAADILRGKTAGQDYKTYILSLIFFKRLSDQWDYESEQKIAELEAERGAPFSAAQRQALRSQGDIHRFTIPEGCHWADVFNEANHIGEVLTRAMREIAAANPELLGVFGVDWNQPAPDGSGKLISNAVVSALIQHFNRLNLSNANVTLDILGRAYEYLIKQFADDAGAKAGEFFTPPEVVDILIRILEPRPGETVYDPTCGSGGMLVHSSDFIKEKGIAPDQIRYFGQELNWSTYAIARINVILHGLEADIRGGKSTITDPQFLEKDGSLKTFDVVIANFPFSDSQWWLGEEQRTKEQAEKARKQAAKEGFKDKYNRFVFGQPPLSVGDYAFIQHILASAQAHGRCGVVCPQGVLFRGQPEVEEETGEFDAKGNPIIRRRKPDDEYRIRSGILASRLVDAVIALPLNIFYGAGVPACLLILNKHRPPERRDQVLLVYAARHYRELSNKNQLRPQDVMRILVHYHAYGDARKAAQLVEIHSQRLQQSIHAEEEDGIGRITLEFQPQADKLAQLEAQIAEARQALSAAATKTERAPLEKSLAALQKAAEKPRRELDKRDQQIVDAHRQAEEDCQSVAQTGAELLSMYQDPPELARHARLVDFAEIEENEFNLNIPRYVDTFEPEEPVDVNEALIKLSEAEDALKSADEELRRLLKGIGYETN